MGNASQPKSQKDDQITSSTAKNNSIVPENKESNIISNNNDNFSKIKQSLKYLHKNNFISLTFVNKNILTN